jgi:hypothetical protein
MEIMTAAPFMEHTTLKWRTKNAQRQHANFLVGDGYP